MIKSEGHELNKLLHRDSLVHFLPKQLHQTLQVLLLRKNIILGKHSLQTPSSDVSLLLQIHKSEVVPQIDTLTINALLHCRNVLMHVSRETYHFQDQLASLLPERVLNIKRLTGSLC